MMPLAVIGHVETTKAAATTVKQALENDFDLSHTITAYKLIGTSLAEFAKILSGPFLTAALGILDTQIDNALPDNDIDVTGFLSIFDTSKMDEFGAVMQDQIDSVMKSASSFQDGQLTQTSNILLISYINIMHTIDAASKVVPTALSLLPGVGKGADFCKHLFPQSPIYGWIVFITPFFYLPLVSAVSQYAL
jgi:hypothetical protein